MKSKLKEEKGITLIALIITIIVLIILAGVSIGEISSRKNSVNESKDTTAFSELTKIQQAVMETYLKYKQFRNINVLKGIQMTYADTVSEFNQLESTESLKVLSYDENSETKPEIYYYKLQKEHLTEMGLNNINNDDEYIVNYSSGEVFNITQRKTANGNALYIYAKK